MHSLRSSRFLFLQAKRGKRARALGKKEQKSRSGGEGRGRKGNGVSFPSPPLPPAPTFLLLFTQCPRALAPLGLKEKETTATQATLQPTFLLLFAQCPRALAPLGLKEKETTATQATSCMVGREDKRTNNRTMFPAQGNSAAIGYQCPVKLELLKGADLLRIFLITIQLLLHKINYMYHYININFL